MKYNPNTKEQIIELSDGRTVYKTHNGFKSFMTDSKGKTIEITDKYYQKALVTSREQANKKRKAS